MPRRCPISTLREWWLLAPIAAGVFWMGVYPESFLRPMRADVGRLLERVERAAPAGDMRISTAGKPQPPAEHHAPRQRIDEPVRTHPARADPDDRRASC